MEAKNADSTEGLSNTRREKLHSRTIEMHGYRRSDGLYEVEGRVTDRKAYDFSPPGPGRGVIKANATIHDMTVRIVFDQSLTVKSIDTQTAFAPYAACKSGGTNFDSLIGLRMIQGWSREVKSRLKGASSCTHLMELLGPMATTAYQTLADVRINTAPELDKDGRPVKIDSCWAYVAHGDVVQHLWPNFYRPSGNRTP